MRLNTRVAGLELAPGGGYVVTAASLRPLYAACDRNHTAQPRGSGRITWLRNVRQVEVISQSRQGTPPTLSDGHRLALGSISHSTL